jgi:mRNA interferase MazF
MYRRMPAPVGWFPRRGELCLAALDKERPVLVVSSDSLNRHSLDVCIVPVSTVEHKAFSLRPKLRAGEGGLARDSWVKCDQVTTLEKKVIRYPPLGAISPESLNRIEQAIKQALELP